MNECVKMLLSTFLNTSSRGENMVLMTANISDGSQVQQIESMCHNLSAATNNNKIIQVFRGVYTKNTLSYSFTVLLTTNTVPLGPLLAGCILHLQ